MNKLIISVSPHIKDKSSTSSIMRDVVIALIPALIASLFIFGMRALVVTAVCVISALISELVFEKLCRRAITIGDFSAVVTGMLLAFNLPVSIPLWQAAFGSVVAIVVVKQLFGGIGMNFANPAITARIVMLVAFSGTMTSWVSPVGNILSFGADFTATATPLAQTAATPKLLDLFLGNIGGSLGETCSLALIIGFIYLLARRVITPHIPVVFVATVFVMFLIFPYEVVGGPTSVGFTYYLLSATEQILSGGLLLGAIFMATDYVTSPVTSLGKIIFGIGCGLITFAIRRFGTLPEGVSYAILFMNIITPYINNWTAIKAFGGVTDEK